MRLSATVIALNEEKNIADCLSALSFADEIIVVDSGSSDGTIRIARGFTPKVFSRKFDDFSSQKNFAVSQAGGEWVLSIDADERVTDELAAEIKETIARSDAADAYRVLRRTNLFGRDFRFSGLQKDAPVRLFRRDKGRFVQPVHEVVEVHGTIGKLKNHLKHRSFQTPSEHQIRLERYTALEAARSDALGRPGPVDFLRPALRFLRVYIWNQGFRDGREGFLYARLSAKYERERWKKMAKKDGAR